MAKIKQHIRKQFSYTAGEKGRNRVRVYRRPGRSGIYMEWFETVFSTGKQRRRQRSLRHDNEARAKGQADQMAAALAVEEESVRSGDVTLNQLFDIYLAEVTPQKSKGVQKRDHSCAEMFLRYFGADRRARTLNRRDWDNFIQDRRVGKIGPAGRSGKFFGQKARGRPVGDRQIGYDLEFLQAVLNWATVSGNGTAARFLDYNPCKGFPLPRERNPKRPRLTDEQYGRMLDAAQEMDWRFKLALILTHETGRRNHSIRHLRWSDIDFERGVVRWEAEYDKIDHEWTTSLTPEAIEALEEARTRYPAISAAWLFPSPQDANKPCSRHLMLKWWNEAQEKAQIPLHDEHGLPTRYGWHSLRRKLATDLLDEDVALRTIQDIGGWKDPNTVVKVYQKSTTEQQRRALEARRNRRASGE